MGLIKPRDTSAWDVKPHKMHGSGALWTLHRSQGTLMRTAEKPRGNKREDGKK